MRLSAPQPGIAAEMQRAVAVDPLLPFAKFRTLDDVRSEAVATQRSQTVLLGALAVLALMLAAVGLYGLVANTVAERRRELGIRIALGASSRQAIAVAATPGLILAVAGVGIGALAARLAATTMRHLVWGISVNDPLTFALAAARRAARRGRRDAGAGRADCAAQSHQGAAAGLTIAGRKGLRYVTPHS